jgi:hypothetical protein
MRLAATPMTVAALAAGKAGGALLAGYRGAGMHGRPGADSPGLRKTRAAGGRRGLGVLDK